MSATLPVKNRNGDRIGKLEWMARRHNGVSLTGWWFYADRPHQANGRFYGECSLKALSETMVTPSILLANPA